MKKNINLKRIVIIAITLVLVAIISVAGVLAYVSSKGAFDTSVTFPEVDATLHLTDGSGNDIALSDVAFSLDNGASFSPVVRFQGPIRTVAKLDLYINAGNIGDETQLNNAFSIAPTSGWYMEKESPTHYVFYSKRATIGEDQTVDYAPAFNHIAIDKTKLDNPADLLGEGFDIQFALTAVQTTQAINLNKDIPLATLKSMFDDIKA